jgi:hypothetical protein
MRQKTWINLGLAFLVLALALALHFGLGRPRVPRAKPLL